jgi:glycogen(starch) synthase
VPETLTVVTPWYPVSNKPFQGSFVQSQVQAVRPLVGRVDVLATDDWLAPRGRFVQSAQLRHHRELAARSVRPVPEDGVWVTRLPVLVQRRLPWDQYARAVADGAAALLQGRRFESDAVHAHVGLPGGLVAVENAAASARVVVTEHASYLDRVLDQPRARALYDETMHRADAWVCVSGVLRDQLLDAFPHHAGKLHVVGNPVDVAGTPVRAEPPQRPRRWLYIGALIERKGPLRLVAAFARCLRDEPDLELTLLGDGLQRDETVALVAELGVGHAVRILDPVAPHLVPGVIAAHDLLVHPSRHETFGMTPVEALATGTPVLVARYAAAEEVLHGVEKEAGGLFDVGDGADEIVEGYRELRDRWHAVDPLAAREVMAARYGHPAVAARLAALYDGTPDPAAAPPDGHHHRTDARTTGKGPAMSSATAATTAVPAAPVTGAAAAPSAAPVGTPRPQAHVLVVSVTRGRRQGVVDDIRYILDTGSKVTFVCMRASEWPEVEGQVTFAELEAVEARHPLLRAERGLITALPNLVLRYTAAVMRRVSRVPGGAAPARVVVTGVEGARRQYMRAGRAYHGRVFMKGYRTIRPWVLWRSARAGLLPTVDLATVDLVLLADAQAVSIGWHLAKSHPELRVAFTLDRSALPPVLP